MEKEVIIEGETGKRPSIPSISSTHKKTKLNKVTTFGFIFFDDYKLFYKMENNNICCEEITIDNIEYQTVSFFEKENKKIKTIPYLKRYYKNFPTSMEEVTIFEEIFGNWQPDNTIVQTVFIESESINSESKEHKTIYKYYKKFKDKKPERQVIIDGTGKANIYGPDDNESNEGNKIIDEMVKEKIYSSSCNGISNGIENEDVTSSILFRKKFIDAQKKDKADRKVFLRCPPNGDGYWKDYFIKDGINKRKFIEDLGLEKENEGFAIVPMSYNGHYVTFVIDLEGKKQIALFDSSLYFIEKKGKEKNKVLRKFLFNNREGNIQLTKKIKEGEVLSKEEINTLPNSILLNNYNGEGSLQGEHEVCGFLNIAFFCEAYQCESFIDLVNNCKESVKKINNNMDEEHFFLRVMKQTSSIVEGTKKGEDIKILMGNKDFANYQIPNNSVCINKKLNFFNGEQESKISEEIQGKINEYSGKNGNSNGKSGHSGNIPSSPYIINKENQANLNELNLIKEDLEKVLTSSDNQNIKINKS